MTIQDFLRDVWTMMLDHWIVTMLIGCVILAPICPVWIVVFGFCKLLSVSKEKHKYDD